MHELIEAKERGIPPTARSIFHAVEATGVVVLLASVLIQAGTIILSM